MGFAFALGFALALGLLLLLEAPARLATDSAALLAVLPAAFAAFTALLPVLFAALFTSLAPDLAALRFRVAAALLLLGVAAAAPIARAQEPECSEALYDEDCEDVDPGEDPDDGEESEVPEAEEPWLPEPDPTPALPPIIRDAPPTVPGKKAQLRRNGKAAIPRGAPKRIRALLAAANIAKLTAPEQS